LNLERLEMLRKRLSKPYLAHPSGATFHLMFDNIEDAVANPAKYASTDKSYLLVEFPDHSISQNMKEIFFRLSMAGLTSIITPPGTATRC